jgi:hypothetical protein
MGDHGGDQVSAGTVFGPWLKARRKSIGAAGIVVLYAIQAALSDGRITGTEWGGILSGSVLTGLVYVIRNDVDPAAQATS